MEKHKLVERKLRKMPTSLTFAGSLGACQGLLGTLRNSRP